MKLAKTILGTEIPKSTRGIVYICKLNYIFLHINVIYEILCDDSYNALHYYANIRNPESQLVTGNTYEELITSLNTLHQNMKKKEWLENLIECI